MDWIPIDWSNPLILLRVYLTVIWAATAAYGARLLWTIPRSSSRWPLIAFSTGAGFVGAVSYFLGAASVFHTLTGFLSVALLLTFTPVALILWLNIASDRERDKAHIDQDDRP